MTKASWDRNQQLLQAARAAVIEQPAARSHQLFQFRTNPSDASFPLAYRRLDRKNLLRVAALVGCEIETA